LKGGYSLKHQTTLTSSNGRDGFDLIIRLYYSALRGTISVFLFRSLFMVYCFDSRENSGGEMDRIEGIGGLNKIKCYDIE
jgi:hypothetical protein